MRLLICGDRNGCFKEEIERLLQQRRHQIEFLITGACRGVDLFAEGVARKLEIPYVGVPAQWEEEGDAAGPLRNQAMLDIWQPTNVAGFHKAINFSKGTKDMLTRSVTFGAETWLFDGEKWRQRR